MTEAEILAKVRKIAEASERNDRAPPPEMLELAAMVICDLHRIADAIEVIAKGKPGS